MTSPSKAVHFPEEVVKGHESDAEVFLQIEEANEEDFDDGTPDEIRNLKLIVKAGYLKINHTYSLGIEGPKDKPQYTKVDEDSLKLSPVDFVQRDAKNNAFTFHIKPKSEGAQLVKITLKSENSGDEDIVFALRCKAFNARQGTPSLKSGLHCIAHPDISSEITEWEGHSHEKEKK